MVINGAMECGPSPPNTHGSPNRQRWYRQYAAMFDLDITGEKLGCEDMAAFSAAGAANPALYWARIPGAPWSPGRPRSQPWWRETTAGVWT